MSVAATPAARIDCYFDFISPYSYLAFESLPAALAGIEPAPLLRYRPVLFAGLLNHWGHLGPAEVPPKRRFTDEHCAWLADRHGIPMRSPRQHPFNPLPLLRAAIAAGSGSEAIGRLFRFVWRDGALPDEPAFAAVLAKTALLLAHFDPRVDGVPIETRLDAALPAIDGVTDQLVQVVLNLLINAADATRSQSERRPAITVATHAGDAQVQLSIADNGCGMDESTLARAFEPLFTTKPAGQGTGLGLPLCREIVKRHDGSIDFRSSPGAGTVVTVALPAWARA